MGNVITPEDLIILKENYSLYETASRSGFVKNYSIQIYRSLLNLYSKYISSTHSYSHWCGDCRFDLVLRLYQWAINQPEFKSLIENTPEVVEEVINTFAVVDTPQVEINEAIKEDAIKEIKRKRGRPKK